MVQFPKTLAACRSADKAQWTIGTALLEECGPPTSHGINDGSHAKIVEVQKELEENGFDYSVITLAKFRNLAHAFVAGPRTARTHSYAVYAEASTPDVIARIEQGLPSGTQLTRALVRDMVTRFHEEEVAARQAELERLDKEIREAAERKQDAQRAIEQAASESARSAARNRLNRVVAQHEKAVTERRKASILPTRREVVVEPERVPEIISSLEAHTTLQRAIRLAQEVKESVEGSQKELRQSSIDVIVRDALRLADIAHEIANIARNRSKTVAGHLTIVQDRSA
jgi:hypothetical protein